ncbi:unnamed protein product [Cuscuta epithymum]|uniref:Uncharacterized protein n=1 Tax=Cuscuta epithymum TaxID=186058 RepID=A0AAV0CQ07_9ASTE|nr:unnamed protein product [Cuscuta epithymum]
MQGESQVHISEVEFHNFTGSSPNKEAVILNCSSLMPCEAIILGELNIRDNLGGPTMLTCTNVHGISYESASSIICADNGIAPSGEVVGTSPVGSIGMAPSTPIGAPSREVGIAPNGVEKIAPCSKVVYAPSKGRSILNYSG